MSYMFQLIKGNNMIMQDYAYKDSRSFSAMLRGRGDGRERSWLAFERKHPELTGENLIELFSKNVRYGRITQDSIFTAYLTKKLYF
jgi:hypothetical protein